MKSRRTLPVMVALLAALGLVGFVGAQAANAASNVSIGGGVAVVAREYEHTNFGGAWITVYNYSQCTASYSDVDFARSSMPSGWNDVVSSATDYNYCDHNYYEDVSYGGDASGWVNATSSGINLWSTLGIAWNDSVSSFRLS